MSQQERATRFQALHHGDTPLLLANAWDAGSARLMESLGAAAVATTSAGVAWVHGYRDGNCLPLSLLEATVSQMVRVIAVPLSVDMEGGFGTTPEAVGQAVGRITAAGAVGINLEDGNDAPEALAARIAAARTAATAQGIDLYINARTDVYLRGLVPPEQRVAEALRRGGIYAEAGASGLFVPGITAPEEIAAVVAGSTEPVNVMARPTLRPLADLARLGVRRLSAGSAIPEALWQQAARLGKGFLATGDSGAVTADLMPYGEINRLFPEG